MNIHSSFICNNKEQETIQILFNRLMDKKPLITHKMVLNSVIKGDKYYIYPNNTDVYKSNHAE